MSMLLHLLLRLLRKESNSIEVFVNLSPAQIFEAYTNDRPISVRFWNLWVARWRPAAPLQQFGDGAEVKAYIYVADAPSDRSINVEMSLIDPFSDAQSDAYAVLLTSGPDGLSGIASPCY